MPYWNQRYRNYWKRRRYWARRRRIRALVRRRRRRRQLWVRKRYLPLPKTIKLRQWNPKIVRHCYIKGIIPLFLCGKDRQIFNFIQYKDSIVPEEQSGGGGWSLMVFNLGGLYSEFTKLNNWWTADNDGLPLVKYLGCEFKFYRSWDTDYVVNYQTCPPMTATELKFLNSQPSRMLMNKKAIKVNNLFRKTEKKMYIRKRFGPPALLKNNWYFAQDFCNQNLLMLTTSGASFDQYYLPNNEVSNNITIVALNANIFHNPNYLQEGTQGYLPKPNYYLWGQGNGSHAKPTNVKGLIYLGNLKTYTFGTAIQQDNDISNTAKWGNPFFHIHGREDTKLYYSTTFPTAVNQNLPLTEAEPLFKRCRYNPLIDTGDGNEVYFKSVSISTGQIYDPPQNPAVHIHGYPLWLIFWGWTDWQEKLKQINQIYLNYQIVIKTKFITPKQTAYVILDKYFYDPDQYLNETDRGHWHPRWQYQKYTANLIGTSGPGTPKTNKSSSIQAKAYYKFHFQWGGCPAPMHNIKDPCEQSKFPSPDNQLQTIQAKDPATDARSMLHDCDERRQTITKKALKRLKMLSETPKTVLSGTSQFDAPQQQESTSEETTEEEEEESPPEQLLRIRKQYRKLKRQLNRLKTFQL